MTDVNGELNGNTETNGIHNETEAIAALSIQQDGIDFQGKSISSLVIFDLDEEKDDEGDETKTTTKKKNKKKKKRIIEVFLFNQRMLLFVS